MGPRVSKPKNESISIVLPVYNRQNKVEERVVELLEDLAELSSSIQMILVDDGSKDATPEILDDMRRRYPQIEVVRSAKQQGPAASVQLGLRSAKGDLVFAQESYDRVDMSEVKQLWSLRSDPELVMARARTRTRQVDQTLLEKLAQWGKRLEENWLGKAYQTSELQMYRREVVAGLTQKKKEDGQLEITHLSHRSISTPKWTQDRVSSKL